MINLRGIITQEIEENGAMSLRKFIEKIASHDNFGYYQNVTSIGKNGDFITAPEISQLFGEVIGVWCVNLWQLLGCPKEFILVELGPGNGTLSADILRISKNIEGFHESLSLHYVELSETLRLKQKEAVKGYPNIEKYWHKSVDSLPKKTAIFIANEFFDALPINQYIRRKTNWYEICVSYDSKNGELTFIELPLDIKTHSKLNEEYSHVPDGGIIEICEIGEEIIREISAHVKEYGGGGLFIDYGYEENKSRLFISSLQAVIAHQYCPIFEHLGEADVSSHVNFSRLISAAKIRGVKAYGPITQRKFLLNMHIRARKDRLCANAGMSVQNEIMSGYNRLISTNQMGLLFKAMAITQDGLQGYLGF